MPSNFTEPDPFAEVAGPIREAVLNRTPAPIVEQEHTREVPPPAPADIVWGDGDDEHADAAQSEYDALRRAEAAELGEVVDRTLTPGVPPAVSEGEALPFAFLWIDAASGRILYRKETSTAAPRRVGVDTLRALIDDGFRLVVPDTGTARRLVRAAAAAAADVESPMGQDAARVERQLAVASRLSYSISLVVLTRALSRRYWLPANLDPENPTAWLRALDPRASLTGRPLGVMQALLSRARDGIEQPNATNAMFYGEMAALGAAKYPGQRARVAAFQGMNRAENGAKVWDVLDLGLLGRNMVTGDVCEAEVTDVDPRGFTASLSQPFKLRTGHRHVLLTAPGDAGSMALSVLVGVRATASGALLGRFEGVTGRARSAVPPVVLAARAAMSEGSVLHITEEPYLPFPGRRGDEDEQGRWTRTRTVERSAGRWNMPADVAAAVATQGEAATR